MGSLEQRLALLPPDVQEQVLSGVDPTDLLYSWRYTAREDQIEVTDSDSHIVLYSAGRGGGKTRTGSEWVREKIRKSHKPLRFALVARTVADVRDVMVQGESGLVSVFPPSETPEYMPTLRKLVFSDGSEGLTFSATEPSQLRGPQFDFSWGDELAAWNHMPDDSGLTAWDNLKIATRLGASPQVLATTTPKRVPVIQDLYDKAGQDSMAVHLVTATTYDNIHLSPVYMEVIRGMYEGTRLGTQELRAILLDEVEGALWVQAAIDEDRVLEHPGKLPLRVVAVDPSVADQPKDECGIIVVGATGQSAAYKRHAYVLDDRSVWASPDKWAKAVVQAARDYDAPVVAEVNNGGALVKNAIHAVDPKIQVRMVSAKKSKHVRAEPVVQAYEQNRVHHVGYHGLLEAQQTSWVPGETKDSPDRVDALVYGVTALVVPGAERLGGVARMTVASGRVPLGAGSVVGGGSVTPISRYR